MARTRPARSTIVAVIASLRPSGSWPLRRLVLRAAAPRLIPLLLRCVHRNRQGDPGQVNAGRLGLGSHASTASARLSLIGRAASGRKFALNCHSLFGSRPGESDRGGRCPGRLLRATPDIVGNAGHARQLGVVSDPGTSIRP